MKVGDKLVLVGLVFIVVLQLLCIYLGVWWALSFGIVITTILVIIIEWALTIEDEEKGDLKNEED